MVEKHTFGSTELPKLIRSDAGDDEVSIELIGLCTDICVVSNALRLNLFRMYDASRDKQPRRRAQAIRG